MKYILSLYVWLLCSLFSLSNCQTTQTTDMKNYAGAWKGELQNPAAFSFAVNLQALAHPQYEIRLESGGQTLVFPLEIESLDNFQVQLGEGLYFEGMLNQETKEISAFFQSGILRYHVSLAKKAKKSFQGKWDIAMVDEFRPNTMYLSVENAQGDNYEAYPFFQEARFTGTWAANFQKENDQIFFQDMKTGLKFQGKLKAQAIELSIILGDQMLTQVDLKPTEEQFQFGSKAPKSTVHTSPPNLKDGWEVASIKDFNFDEQKLMQMVDSIQANALVLTQSVLVAKEGKLVFEGYFNDFQRDTPHDQRSASKSVASALIGIAMQQGLIQDLETSVYDFIPAKYQYTKDAQKEKINLKHLLTMSSGMDVSGRGAVASEDNYQSSPDWLKTILEAKMVDQPGEHLKYGSANPYLLGLALEKVSSLPLEFFMDQNLLAPLGIQNYVIQSDIRGIPYQGGGMYLIPRDMLKFGQLYLNEGTWQGQRIFSKEWAKQSFGNYGFLENTNDKNDYGYLWWHHTYSVGDQKIQSYEARGAGGQYIFVVPTLDLVVVITSGNYRNGKFAQPEKIIEEYILPAVLR